jgi:Protein of unknown function (DUF664)
MDVQELLIDLFGRVREHLEGAVDGLDTTGLTWSPDADANPIGWLAWHLTRVEDHHVSALVGAEQLWVAGDWAARFGLDPDPDDNGYGHTPADVARVRPDGADAVLGYYDAVSTRTTDFLRTLTPSELDRVVDERWDPPVTMGVRLISVADDAAQHAGQAGYVRGLLNRAMPGDGGSS